MKSNIAQKPWPPMQAMAFVFFWLAILSFILWLNDWLLSEARPSLNQLNEMRLSDLIGAIKQIATIGVLYWVYRAVNRIKIKQVLIAGCLYFLLQISYWATQYVGSIDQCIYQLSCGLFEWSYFMPIILWAALVGFCIANYFRERA